MEAIVLAYQARCLPCPLGVRTHSTRGITSFWALARGASIADICRAAGWATPNTLARFYNLHIEQVSIMLCVNHACCAIPLYGPDTCALLLLSSVPRGEPFWSSSRTLGSQVWRNAKCKVQHSCVAQGQRLCWARCPCVVIAIWVISHVYSSTVRLPNWCGGTADFRRALERVSNSGVFQRIPLVSHTDVTSNMTDW